MNDSVIVYGPRGCGKTTHAETLRKHYGLEHIVDDYHFGARMRKGVLYLCVEPPSDPSSLEHIPFETAMAAVQARIDAANVASVHKKYDAQFRKLMADMADEVNTALAVEAVQELDIEPFVTFMPHRGDADRGDVVNALYVTSAGLGLSLRYGDPR